MKVINILLSAFLTVVACDAAAVTLYKLTDKDGLISYSNERPGNFSGSIVPLDIDTTRQPPQSFQSTRESENERIIRRRSPVSDDSAVVLAHLRLDAARAALEDAQDNSSPEDWIYLNRNINPLGMRRAPRPEYLTRLESLEARVKAAETILADAERASRLSR